MAHLNKKCICCSTRYSHCPDCSRADALKPSWASEFCSEPCATLWLTLTRFGMNRLTKDEAKSIISSLDLKPIDSYVACVQRDYAKVIDSDKKDDIEIDETVIEEEPFIVNVDAKITEITEDEVTVEVTPRHKAKKRHEVVIKKENE